MKKAEALQQWRALAEDQDPLPHFKPIPYKAEGSKYGTCGVRIDGTPEFVDAVLSNLKTLLAGENAITRLELSRRPVTPTEVNGQHKGFVNREEQAEVCYIRLHRRGREGSMAAAFFGTPEFGTGREELRRNTEAFAAAVGGGE